MWYLQVAAVTVLALAVRVAFSKSAFAHCDTMDGPAVKDGMKALETQNINFALKWIMPEYESELGEIFTLSLKVRGLSPESKTLADRYFLENLVRLHRVGEGASFDGLKPPGAPMDEKVLAADRCIELGNLTPLSGLVSHDEMHELEKRFGKVMELKDFDVDDVEAGREYIEAYVRFFKFAEGEEEHEHGKGHEHRHHH